MVKFQKKQFLSTAESFQLGREYFVFQKRKNMLCLGPVILADMQRRPPFPFGGGKGTAILKTAYEVEPVSAGIGNTVDYKGTNGIQITPEYTLSRECPKPLFIVSFFL